MVSRPYGTRGLLAILPRAEAPGLLSSGPYGTAQGRLRSPSRSRRARLRLDLVVRATVQFRSRLLRAPWAGWAQDAPAVQEGERRRGELVAAAGGLPGRMA